MVTWKFQKNENEMDEDYMYRNLRYLFKIKGKEIVLDCL